MKKILSVLKNLLPAFIVIIVLIVCASGPELSAIPERLSSEVEASETEAAQEEDNEDDEEIQQAVGDYTDGVYVGSATGYGGLITVQVTVEGGQIVSVEVLDHSGETDSFYNRAAAVIDSILLYQTWEVDAVSGATYSSNGILNAVKNALTGEAAETETVASSSGTSSDSGNSGALAEVEYTDPDGYTDGTYTGSATGFGGKITVSVTISGGIITSIEIVSAAYETESYFEQALAVIDAILAAQSPNVDAVSGATYSSNGIINAVKAALNKAAADYDASEADEDEEEETQAEDSSEENTGGSSASDNDLSSLPNYGYIDGTYTGTGTGYGGDIVVSVTVSGGQITNIKVISAEDETYTYWIQAVTLLDVIIQEQTWEVDAVSGATFSSEGIMEAVKNALANAIASEEEETEEAETETGAEIETETGSEDENEDSGEDEDDTAQTTQTEIYTVSKTVTVEPDEYEDFDAYELTVTATVQKTVTTVTEDGITTITTVTEITAAEYEADTDSTNLKYVSRAWTRLIDSLLAGEEADAVSGATCSSNAIFEAWDEILEEAGTGTSVVTQEDQEIPENNDEDDTSQEVYAKKEDEE